MALSDVKDCEITQELKCKHIRKRIIEKTIDAYLISDPILRPDSIKEKLYIKTVLYLNYIVIKIIITSPLGEFQSQIFLSHKSEKGLIDSIRPFSAISYSLKVSQHLFMDDTTLQLLHSFTYDLHKAYRE